MAHIRTATDTDIVWTAPEKPEDKISVADLEDVLDFLAALVSKLFEGTGRGWLRILLDIGDLADETFSAIDGIENVLPALNNLTDEQRQAIMQRYAERFDLPNDRAEAIVERLLNIVLEGWQVYNLATQKA